MFRLLRVSPKASEGHVEFSVLICVIMFNVDAGGGTVVFAACMNDVGVREGAQVFRQSFGENGFLPCA